MAEGLAERFARWDNEAYTEEFPGPDRAQFNQIHQKLVFFQEVHYRQYMPTEGPEHLGYEARLLDWLDKVPEEANQQTLARLAPQILFFGRDELTKLHQAALRGPITRWIIDELDLHFDNPDIDRIIGEEVHRHTWYWALTDSARISDFCNTNNLGACDLRPELRSIAKFAEDPAQGCFLEDVRRAVLDFMRSHEVAGRDSRLKRIVLIEDFIGSGIQMREFIPRIATLDPGIKVLLTPMIVCPDGALMAREFERTYQNFRFDPVLELEADLFINGASQPSSGSFEHKLQQLARATYPNVQGSNPPDQRPYTPFGFPPPAGTGALVVLFSNTPGNTLSLIHHDSDQWTALFPRSARVW